MTTRLVVDLYHSLVLLTHEGKHVQNQSRGKHSFIFKSPWGPGSRSWSPKKIFQPFGPQFRLKIGGGGPPLDSPLISKFQKASHNNNNLLSINIKKYCFALALVFNPFAPGDFAGKRVLKLAEWFSGHCRAIKS